MAWGRSIRRRLEDSRRLAVSLAGVLLAGSLVWGCAGQTAAEASSEATRGAFSADGASRAAESTTAFGLDLLESEEFGSGNVVFSPTSIACALAMARAGARGDTAAEMDAVMHAAGADAGAMNSLELSLDKLAGVYKDVLDKDQNVSLHVANAPFAQQGLALEQPYLDTLAANFGAGLRLTDFAGDPAAALAAVNGWVSEQTEKRIPNLLSSIDSGTRLMLVNALYMKAAWQAPFIGAGDKPFYDAVGGLVQAPAIFTEVTADYASGAGWRAVDIPYVGHALAMTVIVPSDVAAFERTLTPALFSQITAVLSPADVYLTMPKFKLDTRADLSRTLVLMGMPKAFGQEADFSGITKQEALFISKVQHEATISVDEFGTEATAATSVAMAVGLDMNAVQLVVDHPFIFAVRDRTTGAILFLGRVVDPSA
jgi:serpin B